MLKKRFILFFAFYLVFIFELSSDKIILKNGKTIEGKIINQTREKIFIRLNNGKEEIIDKNQITKITFDAFEQKKLEEERKKQEELRKIEEERKKQEELRKIEEERKKQEELRKLEEERKKQEELRKIEEQKRVKTSISKVNLGFYLGRSNLNQINFIAYDKHMEAFNNLFLSFGAIPAFIFKTSPNQQEMSYSNFKLGIEAEKTKIYINHIRSNDIKSKAKYGIIVREGESQLLRLHVPVSNRNNPFQFHQTELDFHVNIIPMLFIHAGFYHSFSKNNHFHQILEPLPNAPIINFTSSTSSTEEGAKLGIIFAYTYLSHIFEFQYSFLSGNSSSKNNLHIFMIVSSNFDYISYSEFKMKSKLKGNLLSFSYKYLIASDFMFVLNIQNTKKNYIAEKPNTSDMRGFMKKSESPPVVAPLFLPPTIIFSPNLLNQKAYERSISMGFSKNFNLR